MSQLSLKPESLIANKGQVIDIGVRLERSYRKNKYYPLKILLLNTSLTGEDFKKIKRTSDLFKTFRLKDNFDIKIILIEREIHRGDTVTIYTRNTWQTILGMGQQNDIYQIEKNDEILFPIEDMLEYQRSQTVAFAIFALISLVGYAIYLRIRFLEKRRLQST